MTFPRLAIIGILLVTGCGRTPNPSVCCISQADCNSLGVEESIRECADGLVCVEHACVAPQCELDADCGGTEPFCADGLCVGCRDDGDCTGGAPVCEPATHACRGCVADSDCPSQACDFENGACLAESSVLYASPGGTDQADCSMQQPCSITKALGAASIAKPTVKLAPGVYNASVTIDRTVSLHGDSATLVATPIAPAMLVINSAVARIYDLSIVNNNTSGGSNARLGIFCQSEDGVNTPRLDLQRVAIDTQRQPMAINLCRLSVTRSKLRSPRNLTTHQTFIAANGGTAVFDRSLIVGGSSIGAIDASITITNSVIDSLLPSSEAALVANLGSISIAYSTIFNTPLNCTMGEMPACASAARSGVCIENSIVNKPSSPSDTVTGDRCRCDYCLVSPQQASIVGANNLVGDNPSFKDPVNGDFHLQAGSPAIDAAHPSIPGTADHDGVSRPQNGRSDMGAFEFKP